MPEPSPQAVRLSYMYVIGIKRQWQYCSKQPMLYIVVLAKIIYLRYNCSKLVSSTHIELAYREADLIHRVAVCI